MRQGKQAKPGHELCCIQERRKHRSLLFLAFTFGWSRHCLRIFTCRAPNCSPWLAPWPDARECLRRTNMRWTRVIAFIATAIACSFVELKEPAGGFVQKKRKGNRRAGGLPFVDGSGRGSQALFAKDENAILAGETPFFHLSIFPDQHGIIVGLGITLFPAPFTLAADGLPLFSRPFVALNH